MQSQHPDRPVVLIAEPDRTVRELQAFFLASAGFESEFVDDGETAFERARTLLPALVVTEILIPKVDGLALCRRLQDDPLTRKIPVIVFSILRAEVRAGEAGAKAFLRKPLVDTIFIAAIQQLIAAQPNDALEEQWASN
jgi:CheY-like chemotaxis protein